MWFVLRFYTERGEISLLGTISPADARIYFDAESVADAVGAVSSIDRIFILRRAQRFYTLTDGHPRLRNSLPEHISDKKVLSSEDTVLLLALFSGGGVWCEMARILASDDFEKTTTYSLNDEWFHHWTDAFFDPERAIVVTVHPPASRSDDESSTTVQSVVKEIMSLVLEAYDYIENDENSCPNVV